MNSIQVLHENGKLVLKGPMSQADVRNRNGRLYPKATLRKATLELSERVSKQPQTVWSELEHPGYPELIREKACGVLTEVTWDEDSGIAYCKVEILPDTMVGKKVLNGVKNGATYGISTRGAGSLDESKVVQDDLVFHTADVIETLQSCQICRLTEGTENTLDDFLLEKHEECECMFSKMSLSEQIQVREYLAESIIKIFRRN